MPGFHIHLAIGNRYIEKHEVKNKEQFLEGIIAPDFEDKDKSHYTRRIETNSLIEHLKNKVIIEDFFKQNKVQTDYQKGILLHLLTDKLFFTEFFPKEYMEKISYKDFTKDLYTSYGETNDYIAKKYHIQFSKELAEKIEKDIEENRKRKNMTDEKGNNIIPINKLEEFIEKVSDINLDEYIARNQN